ncbi:unnamed protein product [Calypogeia fissa]
MRSEQEHYAGLECAVDVLPINKCWHAATRAEANGRAIRGGRRKPCSNSASISCPEISPIVVVGGMFLPRVLFY